MQATKAASDAWKSMRVEEKAKYTKQARELWDSYLSTAPARIPKPRKQVQTYTWLAIFMHILCHINLTANEYRPN